MDNGPSIEQIAVFIPIIAIVGAFTTAIVLGIAHAARGAIQTSTRERTRRELAAYVAEGTMSSADAAGILEAGTRPSDPATPTGGRRRSIA